MFDALQNVQFLERMKSDPRFKYDPKTKTGGATTNYEIAKQLGWEKSELPQFKEWFMSPEYRRVFDQFAQPGVKGLNWIRNLSQAVTKTMFWLPTAHLDNVFQHWIIARGSGWLSTSGYARLAKTLPEAIKSVMAQDKIQSDMRGVNSDRAAGTVYGGVLAGDFHKTIAEASMMDMYKNPSKWDPVTKALGIDLPTFARKVYGVSKAVMWSGNDMMLTQLYLENKMKGMSHAKAIVNAETHFPNYRLPSTIMGSENLRRGLEDPVALSFGRYHYGMVNSYAHIAKELAYGDKNTKVEAMAKIAVLGAMGFVAYPIMNSMVKSVTGNPGAEMQPRGPFAIPAHIIKALQGKEDAAAALRSTLTVSPLLSTALETLHNTDWRGKPIVEPGEMAKAGHGNVKSIGRAILQQGEHAMRGLVSPVNTAELMAARPESAVGSLAAQLADIKNPTPAANRFAAKQPSINQKNAQARFKKPPGMLESVYNKLVGQ